jgi:hypothetical protein
MDGWTIERRVGDSRSILGCRLGSPLLGGPPRSAEVQPDHEGAQSAKRGLAHNPRESRVVWAVIAG